MAEESHFKIKCSVCGKYGIVRLKKNPIYNYSNKKIKQRRLRGKPEFKIKKDFDPATQTPYTTNVPINRTEHPYRFLAVLDYFCGVKPSKRPVVINPPKPEPRASKTSEALHDLGKAFHLLVKIQPLVEQKYPEIRAIREENEAVLRHAVMMLRKLFNSGIDDRCKRSLPEWALIVKEAVENTPRAAAKKYSGMTPDEREVRLSIKSIHEKKKDLGIQEFFDTYNDYESALLLFVGIVMKKVGQDSELLAAYRQYEKDYDYYQNQIKESKLKEQQSTKEDSLGTGKQDYYDKHQNIDSDRKSYEYFVIRHYDPELRKKQKLDRKRGLRSSKTCDGKIEHKIDEKDIQPEIVQALRSRNRG